MANSGRVLKRLVLGRAMRSDRLGDTLLPKRLALPIFASDALSSVAYAPDEIFLMLGLAGGAFVVTHSWQIAVAVIFVMVVVVASYRQNVHAYPSGGGDYEVATVNLGPKAGLTVASALLVDYVLTVAVSVSSGVQNAATAIPSLRGHEVQVAIGLVIFLTAMNLRGVRESGKAFAVPVYAFILGIVGMGVVGVVQAVTGSLGHAESAQFELIPDPDHEAMVGIATAFLLLRAFSSGCAALTGVEAISNGVPAFQKPKSRNAATTLLMMGLLSITMLGTIIGLGRATDIKIAERPAEQLALNGQPVGEAYIEQNPQDTVLGQLAHAVFGGFTPGIIYVSITTGLILILAANTAFNGFPVLGSILAKDGYLPRQLHTRGDRLAFSNGILILAAARCGPDRRLPGHGHLADPALHRRRLRLVHVEPERDDPALEPSPQGRDRPEGPSPDDALARSSTRSARRCPGSSCSSSSSRSSRPAPATRSSPWPSSSSSCSASVATTARSRRS